MAGSRYMGDVPIQFCLQWSVRQEKQRHSRAGGGGGGLANRRVTHINLHALAVARSRYRPSAGIPRLANVVVTPHRIFRKTGEDAIRPRAVAADPSAHILHLREGSIQRVD